MREPIPGQSLTRKPGAAQYEKPPKHAKPEAAFEAYMEKFDNPEQLEGMFSILEAGFPIETFVKTLTREAVRQGIHSYDTAVILRPMVHEYIKTLADEAKVDYIDTVDSIGKEERLAKREKALIAQRVARQMKQQKEAPSLDMMAEEEESEATEAPVEEEEKVNAVKGLMSRPTQGM